MKTGIAGFRSSSRAGVRAERCRQGAGAVKRLHFPVIVGLEGAAEEHQAALEVFTAQDVGKANLVSAR